MFSSELKRIYALNDSGKRDEALRAACELNQAVSENNLGGSPIWSRATKWSNEGHWEKNDAFKAVTDLICAIAYPTKNDLIQPDEGIQTRPRWIELNEKAGALSPAAQSVARELLRNAQYGITSTNITSLSSEVAKELISWSGVGSLVYLDSMEKVVRCNLRIK